MTLARYGLHLYPKEQHTSFAPPAWSSYSFGGCKKENQASGQVELHSGGVFNSKRVVESFKETTKLIDAISTKQPPKVIVELDSQPAGKRSKGKVGVARPKYEKPNSRLKSDAGREKHQAGMISQWRSGGICLVPSMHDSSSGPCHCTNRLASSKDCFFFLQGSAYWFACPVRYHELLLLMQLRDPLASWPLWLPSNKLSALCFSE